MPSCSTQPSCQQTASRCPRSAPLTNASPGARPAHAPRPPCRHLQQERNGKLDSELATVLSSISLACKQIAGAVGRSGIESLTGSIGAENVQVTNVPGHSPCPPPPLASTCSLACRAAHTCACQKFHPPPLFVRVCLLQGEEQKKLDVISNDIFSMCLRNTGRTGEHVALPPPPAPPPSRVVSLACSLPRPLARRRRPSGFRERS